MLKIRFLSFLLVFVLFGLTACASETGVTTVSKSQPRPPQPIQFDTFSDVAFFVDEPELDTYAEQDFRDAYRQMAEAFQKDGYITYVSHADAQRYNEKVTLFPQVTY